jgi:hypothetical protein
MLVPPASDQLTLGIVSLWGGGINVLAAGDVNVDGSRIAAYDGGNIFVESLDGNVNAGTGGGAPVLIQKVYAIKQGEVGSFADQIPGSGIMATSFPQLAPGQTSSQIGNITVETPEGDIVASHGGIVQLALGAAAVNDATITLNAGSKNSDGSVAYVGNVDATGSGVIGVQVNITATGNVNGLVVASAGVNVSALQNVNATVLSQGAASVTAGLTVSGIVVGAKDVNVAGASDVAAAFSVGNVNASGTPGGAAIPSAPTGGPPPPVPTTQFNPTQSTEVADNSTGDDNDPLKKKKTQLIEYVGRVEVRLPE